jgi:hypothetical protein
MKSYIQNLNGLHIKYIIINLIISLVSIVASLLIKNPGISQKFNMYLSVIIMICILILFFFGRKSYRNGLEKAKELPFGKKLNLYHEINNKRLKTFTYITLTACVGLVLSNNYMYMIFAILSISLILLNRASKPKLKFELKITEQEIEELVKPIQLRKQSTKNKRIK